MQTLKPIYARRRHREVAGLYPKARVRAAERKLFLQDRYDEWREEQDTPGTTWESFTAYMRHVGLPKWRAFVRRDFHMS